MGYRDDYFNDEKNKGNRGWYTCRHCGRKFRKGDVDIDHIIPQSRGGDDSLDNLQCLCKHCNRSKGNRMDDCYDDYKNNTVRRTPANTKEMRELNKALSDGALGVLKWLKKK